MITGAHPAEQHGQDARCGPGGDGLLDDPTAGEADHEAAHHPLSPRSTASTGIGTISLIHVLAEVGPILDRFDTAERAAAGHQPPPPFRCHRSAGAVDPAKHGRSAQRRPLRGVVAPLCGSRVRDRTVWREYPRYTAGDGGKVAT
ncbi:MAG: hypothetical protein WBR33_22325 [Pseudonocardiaceae bacterium]